MTENATCTTETEVVDLFTKVGVDPALIERWVAVHKRQHNLFGAAEYADAEVDPYVDPTRFGSTPITVGQHNTILYSLDSTMMELVNGLSGAVNMAGMLGVPLDSLVDLEAGAARFAHVLDTIEALDALIEAASATGLEFVPEGWTATS